MSFGERWQDIRTGFERPFWVANTTEMFERLSYYAAFASLARYLHENLTIPVQQATFLAGLFGLVWFFAPFGGTIADRLGFRRALALAYAILSVSYFLLGSIGAPWFAPVREKMPLNLVVGIIVMLPAAGIAMLKPVIVGTTARSSREDVRSIGYSIYYTMVNIGSAAGPYLASWVRQRMSVHNVFLLSAASVFLMLFAVLIFFKEPRRDEGSAVPSLAQVGKNFLGVLGNFRFMLFLAIFSGYWVVFWQQYLIMPIYVHDYVSASANTELILVTDPLIVITLTVAINALTRRIPALSAITLGTLITGMAWICLALRPSVPMAVLSLVFLAFGEIIQSPRYYEYISRLAPPGQQGTYMGFAFLPIGVGSLIGGWFSGMLMRHYAEKQHQPEMIWWGVTAVGVVTAVLLFLFDRLVKPMEAAPSTP